jgi:Zn-finger nucleic acid-binding protein
MSAVALLDRSGADLEVDVCQNCQAFWFDRFENTRLSPGATVKLFKLMAEQQHPAAPPFRKRMACPRCRGVLALTHDMQSHATKFEYWRCATHGHFITFLQFLKEKDFVRPLTPKQMAELRQNVQMLNCSNCGAPVDLVKQSTCPHCGSPVTMIDMKQIAAHVRELEEAAAVEAPEHSRSTYTFNWTLHVGNHTETLRSSSASHSNSEHNEPDADRVFAEALAAISSGNGSKSMVKAGLGVVVRLLRNT